MSELTPEEARRTASAIARFVLETDPIEHKNTHRVAVSANMLNDYADRRERELAAEAQREKRVEELAREAYRAYWAHTDVDNWENASQGNWREVIDHLIILCPALADVPPASVQSPDNETCPNEDLRCSCAFGKGHRRDIRKDPR